MSERFEINATERGIVRVFTVDLPEEEIEQFDPASALGVTSLDPQYAELFPVSDLKGVGLSGYMTEGLGIAEDELDKARLDALKGHVLIVLSAAFAGEAVTLTPKAPLRWIGTYTEERAPVQFEPLPDAAAQGQITPQGKKAPSDAAMSGRVATLALLVIFVLTGIMIWIAAS
ncbi:hypothetical protein [Roseovarius sp. 2305UL8-3]|uniref:hypothetical protein n=1 Tax=Roseovarius conchicola TaxID=3121636 RepID=UPI003528F719